ncbi:MAG TPA: translation factor Sua5 [Flavobacteriales bacterium]|nr:translation factor Sua5 [Flavobacteriales bacterium]
MAPRSLKNAPWRDDAIAAVRTLKAGGVILYPTDTVWGLGCRADDAKALDKLYALKGREGAQPSLVLVDAEGLLEEYAHPVPEIAWDLLRESAPESRPMTLVLPGGRDVAPALLAEDGSLAIRVVQEPFLQFILRGIDVPLVSTSANLTGHPTPGHFSEINGALRNGADYVCVTGRDRSGSMTSSMVKLDAAGRIEILRP